MIKLFTQMIRLNLEFHAWRIDEFIESPLIVNNGYTIAPDLPGHGINFDFDKLNQYILD